MTPVTWILVGVIRLYQWVVAPLIGPACRFMPSCSEYAREAVVIRGPAVGVWLAARRLLRCHPWGGEGWDPVPPPAAKNARTHRCADCG